MSPVSSPRPLSSSNDFIQPISYKRHLPSKPFYEKLATSEKVKKIAANIFPFLRIALFFLPIYLGSYTWKALASTFVGVLFLLDFTRKRAEPRERPRRWNNWQDGRSIRGDRAHFPQNSMGQEHFNGRKNENEFKSDDELDFKHVSGNNGYSPNRDSFPPNPQWDPFNSPRQLQNISDPKPNGDGSGLGFGADEQKYFDPHSINDQTPSPFTSAPFDQMSVPNENNRSSDLDENNSSSDLDEKSDDDMKDVTSLLEEKPSYPSLPAYNTLDCTQTDITNTRILIKNLATYTTLQLVLNNSSLKKLGEKIKHLHPFKFLEIIFTNKDSKDHMKKISTKISVISIPFMGSLPGVYPRFIEDLTKTLTTNQANLSHHLANFEKAVGVKSNSLNQFINPINPKGLVSYLIENASPRK